MGGPLFFGGDSTDYENLSGHILTAISQNPYDRGTYRDLLSCFRQWEKESPAEAHRANRKLRKASQQMIRQSIADQHPVQDTEYFYETYYKSLLFDAPVDFDAYAMYIERNRAAKKKFYAPRRRVLRRLATSLQKLTDDELDLLSISLPPGVGKTTIAIFFLTWLAGKFPDEPILTGSHSNSFVRGVYDECLRIFDKQGEYMWHDVFPDVEVSGTNAKDCRIDLGKRKRFETLEFTSIGTGNAGLYRASRLLYCDDLVSGIEVALSRDRLDKLWEIYRTDLRQRKIGDHCKELHIATRWSNHDVIGRLQEEYGDSDRAEFITVPALDENDESNFDYDYGVGFNTEFFIKQRKIMDADASWQALYMNQPIEREGLLFPAGELNYFNGTLPDGDSVRVAVCDVAWGGGDSLSMPIAYIYGNAVYIKDWIFNRGDKEVTRPVVIGRIKQHRLHRVRFEANNGGHEYALKVDEELVKQGYHTNIMSRKAPNNMAKLSRIQQFAPDIKRFYFLDESHQSKEYRAAMRELTTFMQTAKNPHDDSPDSLAMMADEIFHGSQKIEVFLRPC